jgi:hypothetical protein
MLTLTAAKSTLTPILEAVPGFYCRGCKQRVTVYISAVKEGEL